MYGSDYLGSCFQATDDVQESIYPKKELKFGQNLVVSCKISLTLSELQQYCVQNSSNYEITKKYDLKIFNQLLTNFTFLGIFGNADPEYTDDWIPVLKENLHGITIPSSGYFWDAESKTCNNMVGIQVRILASELGFVQNPQNYIVQAQMSGLYDKWTFTKEDTSEGQEFTHYVAFNFVKVVAEEYESTGLGSGLLPSLPEDLFYPLSVSSGGIVSIIQLSTILLLFSLLF